MEILTLSAYLKQTYHTKVYKLSLSSGCTCPNRDGTLGTGGCTFCSAGGSGEFAAPFLPIDKQLAIAKSRVASKFPKNIPPDARRYIAYFQSFTNTYGDPERLYSLYKKAIAPDDIVALSVGTRPDCLPDDMIAMLKQLNAQKPVWVELGLQTIHEQTARAIHRGYPLTAFETAYRKLKTAGLTVIVHVILGLPGETFDDMLATIDYLAALSPALDGIKLQLLQILKGTAMAAQYAEKPWFLPDIDTYCGWIIACLKHLPKNIVIHRITGDGPKRLLVAPKWCANKRHVMNTLMNAIRRA